MKLRLGFLILTGSLVAWCSPSVEAASIPNVQGNIIGIELAPQSVAGEAIFVGVFDGQVGKSNARGCFAIAVTHEPLPGPGEFANLTGGAWELSASRRHFRGVVTQGTLYNQGDDTFVVSATLQLTGGGTGTLTFLGLLNHNTVVPTVTGKIAP